MSVPAGSLGVRGEESARRPQVWFQQPCTSRAMQFRTVSTSGPAEAVGRCWSGGVANPSPRAASPGRLADRCHGTSAPCGRRPCRAERVGGPAALLVLPCQRQLSYHVIVSVRETSARITLAMVHYERLVWFA